jgi:hypothetical protein
MSSLGELKNTPVRGIRWVVFFLTLPAVALAAAFGWAAYEVHHLLGNTAFRISLEVSGDLSAVRRGVDVFFVAAALCAFSVLASWCWCLLGGRTRRRQNTGGGIDNLG